MINIRLDQYPRVEVADRAALRAWLLDNHGDAGPHWLVTGKKAAGDRYVPYDAVVEELLCAGWVDSLPRKLDDQRSMLLITPRKRGSGWSAANKLRIERLTAAGAILPAGRAAITAAQADGSWDRLNASDSGEAPGDLCQALADGSVNDAWAALSLSARKRALELLLSAKRAETRQRRINLIVGALREGRDPTAWQPKQ